jgi:hypothetical protein
MDVKLIRRMILDFFADPGFGPSGI